MARLERMSACLESARRWLRLAFACLAIVAGGLPAQAEARPEPPVAVALHRPQRQGHSRTARRAAPRAPWAARAPRALACDLLRPDPRVPVRAQGPPRALFLDHRALLR